MPQSDDLALLDLFHLHSFVIEDVLGLCLHLTFVITQILGLEICLFLPALFAFLGLLAFFPCLFGVVAEFTFTFVRLFVFLGLFVALSFSAGFDNIM